MRIVIFGLPMLGVKVIAFAAITYCLYEVHPMLAAALIISGITSILDAAVDAYRAYKQNMSIEDQIKEIIKKKE